MVGILCRESAHMPIALALTSRLLEVNLPKNFENHGTNGIVWHSCTLRQRRLSDNPGDRRRFVGWVCTTKYQDSGTDWAGTRAVLPNYLRKNRPRNQSTIREHSRESRRGNFVPSSRNFQDEFFLWTERNVERRWARFVDVPERKKKKD